ncbi:oligosaccharide flippase family protein [Elizabethkingia meningoseptica]|uniref:oligosaccharide flippase family protein n=1 Tax=Elizabethkingia meningoseptica TaxID=238 RepID=UPI00301780B1
MKGFNLQQFILNIQFQFKNNKKIVENYVFMTIFQVLNSFFYILIYPYLIRVLGPDNYGVYVLGVNIATYFQTFISFGFDFPALKEVSLSRDNKPEINRIFSIVFNAKIILALISTVFFLLLFLLLPSLGKYFLVYLICFVNIFSVIIYPQWYFQGLQQMKIVTIVQLVFKVLSLPFIFLFVRKESDLLLFSIITVIFNLFSSLYLLYIIIYKNKVKISVIDFSEILKWVKMSFPFFASNSANTIKQQSTTTLIAIFFSTKDIALYDLALKIFQVPTMLIANVNGAIFPKIVVNAKYNIIKKIIRYEAFICVFIVLFLIFCGKYIISILGGENMLSAYPLLIAISFSSFTILMVGAIMAFVFVPKGMYKFIAYNQFIAFVGYFIFIFIGLSIFKKIVIIPLAITFSALLEIIFSCYIFYKNKSKFY